MQEKCNNYRKKIIEYFILIQFAVKIFMCDCSYSINMHKYIQKWPVSLVVFFIQGSSLLAVSFDQHKTREILPVQWNDLVHTYSTIRSISTHTRTSSPQTKVLLSEEQVRTWCWGGQYCSFSLLSFDLKYNVHNLLHS